MRSLFINSPVLQVIGNALTLSASSSLSLKKGSYDYSLPDKSGTIALKGETELYLLSCWWTSKDILNVPNLLFNLYVSHLNSALHEGSNIFSGININNAVINIFVDDYFKNTNANFRINANGFSYRDTPNVINYVTYDNRVNQLKVFYNNGASSRSANLGDITTFSECVIYVVKVLGTTTTLATN